MWQFPAVEVARDAEAELRAHLANGFRVDLSKLKLAPLPAARHAVTFRDITLLPFLADVPRLPKFPRSKILRIADLRRVPASSATRKIAAAVSGFASEKPLAHPKASRQC
jgi:hypothetical protein